MDKVKVLFVGANPSPHNTDATIPFEGTKSGVTLEKWIAILGLNKDQYECINVSETVTPNVAKLKKKDIDIGKFFFNLCMKCAEMFHGQPMATFMMSAMLQVENRLNEAFEKQSEEDLKKHLTLIEQTELPKIVTLGKLAEGAMEETGLPFFALPHPSGLNRKTNDKDAVQKSLEDCYNWIYNRSTQKENQDAQSSEVVR
jgi:hypothetical protein